MKKSRMRPIGKIIIVALSGLLISACAKPFYRQTPEGQAVGQTMETFWAALRAGDQAALDSQLTADATFTKVVERDSGVEVSLSEILKRQEDRVLLIAAQKARLSNFEQPAPQSALLDTYIEVARRDDIQRVRIHWNLVHDGGAWRLSRVQSTIWAFPKPPRGGGP